MKGQIRAFDNDWIERDREKNENIKIVKINIMKLQNIYIYIQAARLLIKTI